MKINCFYHHYYQLTDKSLADCQMHGSEHKAYNWNPRIDPRWNEEQVEWYLKGYEPTEKQKERIFNA